MEADNEDYQDVEDPIGTGRPFDNAFMPYPGKSTKTFL